MLCNCAIDADNQINVGATRQSSTTGVKELEEEKNVTLLHESVSFHSQMKIFLHGLGVTVGGGIIFIMWI